MRHATSTSSKLKTEDIAAGNEVGDTCSFKQDGETLTATCKSFTNVNGKLTGNVVTLDRNGTQASLNLSGKLEGNKITATQST